MSSVNIYHNQNRLHCYHQKDEGQVVFLSVEILLDGKHKPREFALMHLMTIINERQALRYTKPLSGSCHRYIEPAGIFCLPCRVMLTEIVRITSLDGIEDNDIVKLQSFSFMDGGHKDTVANTMTVTEVCLLQRIDLNKMASQLLGKLAVVYPVDDLLV